VRPPAPADHGVASATPARAGAGPPLNRTLLHVLFALSGFAGLVWQVTWVRQLGLVYGSTVQAMTLVTAIFLLGLGLGGRLGGGLADRAGGPRGAAGTALRAYAACELGVAGWGVLLVPVLAALASRGFGTTAVDAHGWLVPALSTRAAEGVLTLLLLGPPTLLMGASLPLLARPTVGGRLDLAGWRLGVLAAANTGGAAFGALATDLWLVPALGLRGTQVAAAGAGVIAGLGALALVAGRRELPGLGSPVPEPAARDGTVPECGVPHPAPDAPPAAVADSPERAATARPGAVAIAVALAGFSAMGFEVVWFRFLGSALGPYRAVFSVLLAVILSGWLGGALLGGALQRRFGHPAALFAAAQAAVATFALGGLAAYDSGALLARQLTLATAAPDTLRILEHAVNLRTAAGVVLPAAVAMGVAFPLANTLIGHRSDALGRGVGHLWLATTLGNAGGALVTGLGLLPMLGLQHTALLLAAIAAIAPLVLLGRGAGIAFPPPGARRRPPLALLRRPAASATRERPARATTLATLGLVAGPILGLAAVAAFATLPADALLWASFPYGRARDEGVLAVKEGVNETIVVTGTEPGPARLWTNGHPMSSTTDHAQRYMRLMAHLPLLAEADPRRVLVICFGVGNTLHAAALHPSVTRLDLADISADVLAQAPHFAHANHGVRDDPRVHVFVDDGRHVLAAMPTGTYDLVTLEPPPIAHAGVASLYTEEFYTLARDRLADGGWLTQWLPAYQVPGDTVLALVRAFVDVFPDAVLLVGDGRELILAGVKGGAPRLDADAVSARLAATPAVAADLAHVGITGVADLAATFAAPGATLAAAARDTAPMTDDRPVAEAAGVSHVMATRLPPALFAPDRWPTFAPTLADDPLLAARMEANAATWRGEDYLSFSNLGP
jgi:spermidine synthase